MDSAINSSGSELRVPLLALRLPDFEQIAWREGKRAARRLERRAARIFREAAARSLRRKDERIHGEGSDVFAALLVDRSRGETAPEGAACRAVLRRLAGAMTAQTGMRVQSGWGMIAQNTASDRLNAQIEEALEQGALEQERYEFFSAVGHELRTPLASIRGYLETVIDGDLDARTAQRFLQTAQREALRMGRLIEGMFEFSLLDLSSSPLPHGSCDLAQEAASACDSVAPQARMRGVAISCDVPACELAIERDACLHLLVNLLENALKYGRRSGNIAITARTRGRSVVLSVDDDGPGVPPEERAAIFALRARGKTGAPERGHGIGLAIVRMIAERAGGSVRVAESALGGARFEVVLPAKAEIAAHVS